jgi:hypothetical protein
MKGALNAYAKNQNSHIVVAPIPAPDLDPARLGAPTSAKANDMSENLSCEMVETT